MVSEKSPNVFQISNDAQQPRVSKASKRVKNLKDCMFHPMVFEGREHSTSQCHIVRDNPSLLEKFSDTSEKSNHIFLNQAAKRPFEQIRQFPTMQENSSSNRSNSLQESGKFSTISKPSPEYFVSSNGKIHKNSIYPTFF